MSITANHLDPGLTDCLRDVLDPEIGLNIVDLGLVIEARRSAAEIAVRAAEKAVADCVLRAPSAGTILRVQTGQGEFVTPGHPRAPILFRPDGPLVVRVELEQEFLSRVSTGAKATIRDEMRSDSPTWTGRVLSVAPSLAKTLLVPW